MKWRAKTAAMFIVMTAVLLAVGLAIGWLVGEAWTIEGGMFIGLIAMFILAIVFNLYAYFGSKKRALKANKVRLVTEIEEPRLHRIVRNVATKAGIPMPEVGVTETLAPNAFATGRGPKNAAVVATRGLLNMLTDEELEGVMAHEIAHVKNRDILVMTVASTMAAVLSYLAFYARIIAFTGGGANNRGNGYIILVAIALSITVPLAAMLVRLGVSRSREFLADESGAKITNNPLALASALKRISSGAAGPSVPQEEYSSPSYADMWISDPIRKKSFTANLFSTHPPMEVRVQKLSEMAVKMGQIRMQVDPFKR
jgi:heat shock protein HtpX